MAANFSLSYGLFVLTPMCFIIYPKRAVVHIVGSIVEVHTHSNPVSCIRDT